MTDSVVVEGHVKLRDGKKWKSRWLVLRKPSPVAVLLLLDCLLMLVYKDKSERAKGHKERSSMTLEDICGLDPGLSYEGLNHTLAIICLSQVVMLGFDNKETMYAWDVRIRYSLGEVHRFQVFVAPGTKLESGPATLHFCNDILVLVKDLPPSVMGQWKLSDLRRYGAVPNGFIFEGGTRCGFWAGVFFLSCAEGEQISFLFDCIVRGISPTKGPFGLRPVLPDPSTNPAYSEERLAHEALQLEKRLSLLSHTSRQGSGGDDRSLSSSSSDTSHSDVSVGSRLTIWPEQSSASTSQESHGLAAAKGIHLGEEKTLPEGARGTTKLPPKPLRSRQLQEIGRQSSSDSGIATGSHSSYSGSFSSYAGSLDICHGDEFGSLLSLPLNFPSDQNLCTCPHSELQRGVGSEYQVPSSLRHVYDIPRSLLQAASKDVQPKSADSTLPKDQALSTQGASDPKLRLPHLEAWRVPERSQDRGRPSSLLTESSKDSSDETYVDFVSRWSDTKPQGQVSDSKSSELSPPRGPSADPCDTCSPHPGMTRALFSACPICGGLKGTAILQSGVLPAIPGSTSVMAVSGSLKMHRGHSLQAGPKGGYEMLILPAEPGTPTSPEEPEGAVGYSTDVPTPDRPHSEAATYVNIPVSPTSKKQLHYMELELQEPGTSIRGSGSSRYAQIDIAATETAHKVGTQHAQCREERLQELEQKKKGTQQ
ncbi:protein Dok-7 isoform X1 [Falco biarmicus]|uniref:protein Dok-7 isoform X1 n=1 Tax=Falco rusticolus TaxID=120794 RepID=UPI001886728C|nr:protein Dok-7 isoform X1 [Falco rusticolus]XP_055556652.1 protein Dok-7 isoform X1 [Falco cherrug]XP_056194949.1 protein Dok-7 isoform X1 [Falco biarmicus]